MGENLPALQPWARMTQPASNNLVNIYIFSFFLKHIYLFILFILVAPGLSYSMEDLVPQPGIETRPPSLGAW